MSRASRRERRESAKRAYNPKKTTDSYVNKLSNESESKEDRLRRMQELYKQSKLLGEKS